MENDKQRADQVERLFVHAEPEPQEIEVKIECSLCERTYAGYVDRLDEVLDMKRDIAEQAYQAGWRYSTSKVFAVVGPMCDRCYPNKDDGKVWEDDL